VRKKLVTASTLLWMAALFPFFLPFALVFPTQAWRLRVAMAYAKMWTWGFFRLSGIRLRVSGREHMTTRPAVYLFNHTNELDFFANASIAPYFTLVYGKRELAKVPFLGWMWLLGGHPMIKREDRSQWQEVLDWTTRMVATGRYATMIAPEGTRTRDGTLRPFKKGPFHIAMAANAPVVPIVIHDAAARLNKAGLHPGELRLTVLPPVPTAEWTEDDLEAHIAEVRALYLDALGQSEAEATPQPS
jgi:1-acyl-sn-glycerol-3-phosphate acyltransferase